MRGSKTIGPKTEWKALPVLGTWATVAIVLIWITLLPRVIPYLGDDRGIFVSVAERILAGDILYNDVWDNKDPLFFFGIAITRIISPYADIFVEVFWIISSGFAALVIARWIGCNEPAAWFAALGMTPLIMTGGFYVPGHTHLPGIALALWAVAAAISQRFVAAGALLGILVFTKIVMLPIAFLMLLIIILSQREWRPVRLTSAGLAVAVAAVLAVLLARGELQPYAQSLVHNASYSQGSLVDGTGGPFVRHLLRMASPQTLSVAVLILLLTAWVVFARTRRGDRFRLDRRSLILSASVGSSLLGAVLVLGFTGLWNHHAQVLYVAAVLASIGFIHLLQPMFDIGPALPVVTFTSLALCMSGLASPTAYLESVARSISSAPAYLQSLGSLSTEAQAVLSVGERGTYARVGQNDDRGHAYGLANWELVCPRFHQYPFDSAQTLRDVSVCLPSAEVIVVSPTAAQISGYELWNAYVERVEAMLRVHYSCTSWEDERICVRHSL